MTTHLADPDTPQTASMSSPIFSPADTQKSMPLDDKSIASAQNPNESHDTLSKLEKGPVDTTPAEKKTEPYLVVFDGPNDADNPKNWTEKRRWAITISLALLVFTVTWASSIFAVNIGAVQKKFHTDKVTATLGVSLFVLGFVFGPIVFGPMSEVLGRKMPLFVGFLFFAIFQIPVAVAQNIATICVCRFISGFCAAGPLTVMGGCIADLWDPIPRAYAICLFAFGGFAGPVAGPIVGGFVTESSLGWRWTSWLTLIVAAAVGIPGFFIVPETSAPRILQYRAAKIRKETGESNYYAAADQNKLTANKIVTVYLTRPFVMLFQEPILALLTAYMSCLYGIIYLLFEAYPVSFLEQRGWSLGVSELPFVAFIFGILMGSAIIAISTKTIFTKSYIKHGKAIPEDRLPPMILGAIILPIGLFMFAWTSSPHISWVPQVIATGLIGMGIMVPFWQGIAYIIDCYEFYSNSAIAVNTFMRSIFGAIFPLFANAMYRRLGVAWASSLLAFICVAFVPVPVLFYMYGAKIRQKSKWAPKAA